MSSGRLFRSECFLAFRMCSFSVRQVASLGFAAV